MGRLTAMSQTDQEEENKVSKRRVDLTSFGKLETHQALRRSVRLLQRPARLS